MDANIMNVAKMSGYLEKKGKKKIIASYKKYWFVLEGRLLIYYRSKTEYEAISPCKGSITLGPSCNVKPCSSSPGVFQIENRSSTITLKAENREEQNKWMQSIMVAIDPNKNQPKLCHFRYSMDDLPKAQTQQKYKDNASSSQEAISQPQNTNKGLIHRLQKMGAHTYGSPLGTIKSESTTKSSCIEFLDESSSHPLKFDLIQRTASGIGRVPSGEHIYERISGEPITKTVNGTQDFNFIANSETDSNENEKSKNNTPSTKLYEINQLKDELDYEELPVKSGTIDNHKEVKRKKSKNNKETDVCADKKRVKLKKCTSFIRKVWERKTKHKEKEQIYETLFDAVEGDKITIDNGTAVQMLSELQNILEHKSSFLPVNNTSTPSTNSSTSEILCDPMDMIDVQTPSENHRKNESGSTFSLQTDERLATSPSSYHNITEDYTYEISSTKSLDEILDDLDDQRNKEAGNTVKKLIKRFSAADCTENEVVLRRNSRNYPREDVDSDELSILLEELAKVTNAPIFTPGATCSLITTNVEDIELFNLLPPRKRRYSEPDYDVPRPHKSLVNLPREQPTDGVIGSTRFFGPVLKPFDMDIFNDCGDLDSMTPDSLETDHYSSNRTRPAALIEKFTSTPRNPFGRQFIPYTSAERNYIDNVTVDRIYSPPKSCHKFHSLVQSLPKTDECIDGGVDEAFVDSLEISNANPTKPF